jgi:transposase
VQAIAPPVWYERYGKRIEDTRLPQGQAQRDAYAQIVGEDGFALLDALEAPETPEPLRELPRIATLR